MKTLAFTIFVFIILLINTFLAYLYPNVKLLLGYFSVFFLTIWLIFLFNKNKKLFFSNLYFSLSLIATVAISIILEFGVFLTEIQEVTYSTGLPVHASMQIFLLFSGLFLGYHLLLNYFFKSISFFQFNPYSTKILERLYLFLYCCILVILMFIVIIYGSPTITNLHRQDYWSTVAPSWGSSLVNAIIQMNLGLGFLYKKNSRPKVYLLGMLASLIILFALGVRFTGLITTLFLFFIPVLITQQKNFSLLNKKVLYSLIFILLIMSLGLIIGFQNMDGTSSAQRIVIRLTLQPQMWWIMDVNSTIYPKHLDYIVSHYLGLGVEIDNTGPYYLMYKFAPEYIVNSLFETKSTFTSIGIFNHVYYFGYIIGGLINFTYGILLSIISWLFISAIQSKNLLVTLLFFRLLYLIQIMIVSGTNYQLFNIDYLILFTIMIIVLIQSKIKLNTKIA